MKNHPTGYPMERNFFDDLFPHDVQNSWAVKKRDPGCSTAFLEDEILPNSIAHLKTDISPENWRLADEVSFEN